MWAARSKLQNCVVHAVDFVTRNAPSNVLPKQMQCRVYKIWNCRFHLQNQAYSASRLHMPTCNKKTMHAWRVNPIEFILFSATFGDACQRSVWNSFTVVCLFNVTNWNIRYTDGIQAYVPCLPFTMSYGEELDGALMLASAAKHTSELLLIFDSWLLIWLCPLPRNCCNPAKNFKTKTTWIYI